MTDQSVYGGLFKDPTYLSSDIDPKKTDPYDKQDCIPSRYLGKSMVVGHPAPGPHPDSFLEKKYLTLASSEQNGGKPVGYADGSDVKGTAAAGGKPISDRQFKYSSFPHKSTGPGSYYGCFQETPHEYMTEPWDDGKKKKKRRNKSVAKEESPGRALPNIKTNPAKKGTYGYPGLLLEREMYNENWLSDLQRLQKEEEKRAKRAGPEPKQLGPAFKVMGVSHAYLDELPSTGAPGVYTEYIQLEDKKRKKKLAAKEAAAPKPLHEKAFKGSTVKSGDQGCLNPFPNVWIDPAEVEASKKGKNRRNKKPATADEGHRPKDMPQWKPNSFEKSSIISSCLRRFY